MRYGFINNFSQALAADLAAGATTLTLDGGGADLGAASADLVYALTLDDGEGTVEIVHVTGQTTNDLTIVRAQEGTTSQAWPTGSTVEMRVTAGIMGGAVLTTTDSNTIGLGASVTGATNAISIGPSAAVTANFGVALGDNATASGAYGFALGPYATAGGVNSVAIGYSSAMGADSICIGEAAVIQGDRSVRIGGGNNCKGIESVILGHNAYDYVDSDYSVIIGAGANAYGFGSLAVGHQASADNTDNVAAIGPKAEPVAIAGALDITYVPVTKKAIAAKNTYQHDACMRVSLPSLLRTPVVSLATTGNKDSITLPAGLYLMVEKIEAVVTSTAAAGSTPTINIGTTAGGNDVADSYVFSSDALRSRHAIVATPPAEALSALHFSVEVAAGNAMDVMFIVHGYVMEL